ncbi:MAG: Mth938-like domain-containing protein [Burkholderiales bacterium]
MRRPLASPTPHLKLHLDRFDGRNAFSGYGQGYVTLNGRQHHRSLVVFPDRIVDPWEVARAEELDEADLSVLAGQPLEIALIGTGDRHHMIHPGRYRALSAARIGVEVMSTPAACRTYNILLAEGRKVAAALIVG